MKTRRSVALVACLAAAGCPPPPVTGPTIVTVGTVDPNNPVGTFTTLSDGAMVGLNAGNQGGQHVWIAIRASGIEPTHPRVEVDLFRASDGVMIGANDYSGDTWMPVGGQPVATYSSVPLAAQIFPFRYCPLLHGGSVRVHVHIDDLAGHAQDHDVTVVLDGWTSWTDMTLSAQRDACCADYSNTMCWPDGPPADAGSDAGDAAPDVVIDTDAADATPDAAAADASVDAAGIDAGDA